ncbi:translocation/assembly module TamB domain-containing protein [Flavobacterium hiemivividum]|uniref:Translocation/assembly module TamB n=1 Tax=Flavobacterium hiemivividum TaxID=2541734 RepID=A0A4R5D4W8_9FLAO|nr:translocation/assembly module TamB domain-containing protein [Flavobacterium hiemivividum]TDE05415.1 translocation/assembly module TamB [Flavobacterium hiemivividum]
MKEYLKKGLKVIQWTVGIIIVLFLLILLLIQIPYVQNFAKDKAVIYLESKIKTKVSVAKIDIGFPKKIILEGVYIEGLKQDTLLLANRLAVDISMFQLLNNKVEINSIDFHGVSANINRDSTSVYNFDYIIKAFSSPEKQDPEATPMTFSLEKINLDTINLRYTDAFSKNDMYIKLQHLETRIKTFDLDAMAFEVPKIKIKGLDLKYKQGIAQTNIQEDNAPPTSYTLLLGEIDLSKIAVDYKDELNKLSTTLSLKNAVVKFDKTDFYNRFFLIDVLNLSDANGKLALGKTEKNTTKKESAPNESRDWDFKVRQSNFKRVDFNYDNNNITALPKGFDSNHLKLKSLSFDTQDIHYSSVSISGKVNDFSAKEQSGLNIESFKADFFYGKTNSFLKNLYLRTPQTLVRDELLIGYSSIAAISENLENLSINATLKKSSVGFKDILLFVPSLANTVPFKDNPNAILNVDSKVYGKLSAVTIPSLEISGIGNTKIVGSGTITGLPDTQKAYFDLDIKEFASTAKDFNTFLPKETIPNSMRLPAAFNASGTFKGTINNFSTNLDLKSSFGPAKIIAAFDQRIKNKEKYDVKAKLENFDLGKLIKNNSIGKISLNATVKGSGLDPKTANAAVKGTIGKFNYNKYNYTNLDLKGNINNGLFQAVAASNDPNLTFDLVSSGSFKDKYPTGKIKLNVDVADLAKLNLHAGPMKIRGEIDADLQSVDLDYLNGNFNVTNLTIADENEQFVMDSITMVITSTANRNALTFKSPFLNAEIEGKYKLATIADALTNSIAHYYNPNQNKQATTAEKQQLAFNIRIADSPLLIKFIPELKSLEPISITGRYNTVNDSIVLNGAIPKLIYGDNTITNGVLKVDTKDNALVYSLVVDDIQNSQFQLPYTSINGIVQDNTAAYTFQLKDLKDKERYLVSGTLKAASGNNELRLDPNNLLLNYESWKMDNNNLLRFGEKGIYASNFELSKEQSSIRIQSQSTQENAPLSIDFTNFKIETITNIAVKGDLEIGGNINGKAVVKNLNQTPIFTADMIVDNFAFKKDTVGTVNLHVNNKVADTYNTRVSITGQDNLVDLNGTYKTGEGILDMNLDISRINLKSIQGFTLDNLKESSGFFSGNFKISGKANQPLVVGDLKFNEIGFKVTPLNSTFKSLNDKIVFTGNTIVFNRFTIKDERDNDLVINGKIATQNLSNIGYDLSLDAVNFKAINSQEKDNDLYYGEMYLDNHLKIGGTFKSPIVDGNIKVNKDTKFTIVMPQSDPSIADREGIVEFIDQDNPPMIQKTLRADEALSNLEITGINASVNIEIDKEAELSIVIDKANGDFLKLKGEAQLTGGIDPSGKTTLTGRYELKEGAYEMNFNLIKRKFDIKSGSYILWTGEPTEADINIIAVYKNEAAPIDLVDDQLANVSASVRNTYKQKIPFETELKMKGDLMKPSISFDILMPEGNNSVSTEIINTTQAKLTQLRQQPDELNKQVFALLLLNRFIGENPFASESGGASVSSIARESASKILSQQLNNLAGNLISGVELNFDLVSSQDYTTGQLENKTDLNVGISKKLLNDRLKITVGSSFGLEGPQQQNQEANTIAGDVTIEYQLSKDGRYKLKAYRINKYQVALQGQVVETGLAFVITLDYDKFRELFEKEKTDKKKNK